MQNLLLTSAAIGALLLCGGAIATQTATAAQVSSVAMGEGAKHVRITYENLTTSQRFSPSVFFTHNQSVPPLFKDGAMAVFGLMRIAEEGNAGPLLSAEIVPNITGPYGTAVDAISILPGQTRIVEIDVTKEHPLISGAWMMVMTNDGFTGISAVNAYELSGPESKELFAWDAGTENNNETKSHLIAMMGTDRDPENGVVHRHEGIRGDADAPAEWKFDPSEPVARITIEPVDEPMATGSILEQPAQ